MRVFLLASSLFIPTIAFCAPSCAIPQDTADAAMPAFGPAVQSDTATSLPEGPGRIGPDKVGRVPALRRIASNGAQLYDLGVQHGLQTVFARNGNTFQVFYLTPDGQGAVGGVMWDAAGNNVTRGQVALIDGTTPTVTIGSPPAVAGSSQTPNQLADRPAESALKIAEGTVYGTAGADGAPRLYMFVDPLCSFSVKALDQLRPYIAAGKLQLAVIPLSVLDYEDQGQSTIAAKSLLSLPSDQIVTAWQNQRTTPLPPASADATARLGQNMAAAETLKLRGTPTLVWRKADGTEGQAIGVPDSIDAIIASMGS